MLFIDTSALIKRYVDEEGTALVLRSMEDDHAWVVSSLARTEAEIAFCRLGFENSPISVPRQRLRDDWDRCLVVPVDRECLDRAADIGCRYDIRTLDALHLAAADRLPPPVTLLTFVRRQADAAGAMGFVVQGVTEVGG